MHDAPAVFEDEADTITVDPGFDTKPIVDAFETTRPIELKVDTLRDGLEVIDAEDDTDTVRLARLSDTVRLARLSDEITGVRPRPSTNADWPPAPKQPANRKQRTAGMYKAISSITKVMKNS